MNNMRLEKFFVFGLGNFSRKIDEVLILMIFPNFRPPVVEKVDKPER